LNSILEVSHGRGNLTDRRKFWAAVGLILLAVFLTYLPVLKAGFTNWDDPLFVLDNLYIRSFNPVSLKWILTGLLGNWAPVTWLSYSLDYRLGGLDPFWFHLQNLILHFLATVLVFLLVRQIGEVSALPDKSGKPAARVYPLVSVAWIVALFFGVHPLHVENVAWITGRIDLLCGVFYLASLLFYLKLTAGNPRPRASFTLSLGFYGLAFMSKSNAVTLPLVLMLLDVWPLRKPWKGLGNLLKEKAVFLLPALAVGVATILARQQLNSVASLMLVPMDYRIMNAFHSIFFYPWKMLMPFELCPLYPMLQGSTYSGPYVLSLVGFGIVSVFCVRTWKRAPEYSVAWLFYILTLLPTLGLISVGSQAAADRYAYLPSLVPFILVAILINRLFPTKRLFAAVLVIGLSAGLAWGARQQVGYWKDSTSLWEHELRYYPINYPSAYSCLGDAYREAGNLDGALRLYELGLQGFPNLAFLHNGKGAVLLEMGRNEEAVQAFQDALSTSVSGDDQAALAHAHLDVLYSRMGKGDLAEKERGLALSAAPTNAWQHFDLGERYLKYGFPEQAQAQFRLADKIYPWYAEARAKCDGIPTR